MTTTPQSRVQLLDNPSALPGHCALCGSVGGDGRKFLDWGFQLDWFGAVYFCTFCLVEVATGSGLFVTKESYNSLEEIYDATLDANVLLSGENGRLKNVLAGLGVDYDRICTLDAVAIPLEADKPEPEESAGSDRSIDDAEGSEPESDKSGGSKKRRSTRRTESDNPADDGEISLSGLLDI